MWTLHSVDSGEAPLSGRWRFPTWSQLATGSPEMEHPGGYHVGDVVPQEVTYEVTKAMMPSGDRPMGGTIAVRLDPVT